jgi:hypothetical protein
MACLRGRMRGEKKRGGGIRRHLLTVWRKEGGPGRASVWRREKNGGGSAWRGSRWPAPARGRRAPAGGAAPSRGDGSRTRGPGTTVTGSAV